MTLDDLLDEQGRALLARHVPGVDPRSVRVSRLPAWYRRATGIAPDAVTVGDRVLLDDRVARLERCRRLALLAHEATHVAQQRSGRLGFGIAYAVAYAVGRLRGRSHEAAYRAIPAEVLAREVQRRVLADCRGRGPATS